MNEESHLNNVQWLQKPIVDGKQMGPYTSHGGNALCGQNSVRFRVDKGHVWAGSGSLNDISFRKMHNVLAIGPGAEAVAVSRVQWMPPVE